MASLIWLIVWLVQGTPNLEWFGSWNDWAVALLACAVFIRLQRSRGCRAPVEPVGGSPGRRPARREES